jgi:hypothetical protein
MRPGPTQADILLPFVGDREGVIELLDNIMEKTEIPCRIILCDDGNQAGVMEGLRIFAKQSSVPMVAFRNEQPMGWAESVRRCRSHLNPMHDFFAVLPPWQLFESNTWFGQLIAPLQRDGIAYAAITNPEVVWNSNTPVRLMQSPNISRTLTMFKRKSNPPIPIGPSDNYGADLFSAARKTGNTIWEVPAVRTKPSSGRLFRFVELLEPELKKRTGREPQLAINR